MNKGYLLIGAGLVGMFLIWRLNQGLVGPKLPTGSGVGQNPASPPALDGIMSLDGSLDGVNVIPNAQTEAAYNQDPTDMTDAFGPAENNQGTEFDTTGSLFSDD